MALLAGLCGPAAAQTTSSWKLVAVDPANNDRLYVDLGSVRSDGALLTFKLMRLYSAPRPNAHNLVMDRVEDRVGADCANQLGAIIQTAGFLENRRVGLTPEAQDWKARLKPISGFGSDKVLAAACGLSVGGGPAPASGPPAADARPPVGGFSLGSGLFINRDGFLLTNVHVIAGCKTIVVKAYDADPQPAHLEAADPKNDLALLRTAPGYGEPARFRTQGDPVKLGEDVGVVGYPLPGILSNEPKATFGDVSSTAGINNDYTLLQISAPIQPGNSGGPVFDEFGLVVGVVVSQVNYKMAAVTGSMPQNLNFAIRGEIAQIFLAAHGASFESDSPGWRMDTEKIAARGEREAAQVVCQH